MTGLVIFLNKRIIETVSIMCAQTPQTIKNKKTIVTGTSYEYLYTNDTVRKTLGFTVTARENKTLTGEASRMVYNTASQSEWVY